MTTLSLATISSGYNLSIINDNFQAVQESLNTDKLAVTGGSNTMKQDLDMNGFSILNANVDTSDEGSLLTVKVADARYYNISGDTLQGPMVVAGYAITGLAVPTDPTSPVRKDQLDSEAATRA